MIAPAFYAIREVADILVCSLAEASMLLVSLLAPIFSLLSIDKLTLRRVIELLKRYGLQDRFIEWDSIQITSTEFFQTGLENPQITLEPTRDVAREAVKKGVCIFVT